MMGTYDLYIEPGFIFNATNFLFVSSFDRAVLQKSCSDLGNELLEFISDFCS